MKVPLSSFSFELRKSSTSLVDSARSCDELLEHSVPLFRLALSVSILMCL